MQHITLQQEQAEVEAAVDALMVEFLEWIDRRPRTYDETMAAWRTGCPRFPVWEDAHAAGFVRVCRAQQRRSPRLVVLTAGGRERINRTDH